MAQLVTTAVIRAHDELTGPLMAMANKVRAAGASMAAGVAQSAQATKQHVTTAATRAGAAGLAMFGLLEHTQEFNKAIFGMGAASLIDEKTGKASVTDAQKQMDDLTKTSLEMGRAMGFSSTKIAQAGEVFAKAGLKQGLDDILKATVTLSKADTETPINKIADFMHTLTVIYAKDFKKGPGDFIRNQADMILTAADQTKLSIGTIMEGMKQFQTIGAGMGMKTPEMLSMLMVGNQAGFSAIELGTAYKSNLVRLFKPTAEGQAALAMMYNKMGTSLADYTHVAAQDPTRATTNMARAMGMFGRGYTSFNNDIKRQLYDAQKGGFSTQDWFIDKIANQYAKKKGVTDLKGQQEIRRMVQSGMLTTGGEDASFDVLKMLKDMKRAGLSPAQMASVFQGQHLARNKPLMDALLPGPNGETSQFDQYVQLLERMHGQGLDAVETLWSQSVYGNIEAMKAAFDRLWIVLGNSKVVQSWVNSLERGVDALSKMNPELLNAGLQFAGIAAAAAIALPVFAALTTPFGALLAAAGLIIANFPAARQAVIDFATAVYTNLSGALTGAIDTASQFSAGFKEQWGKAFGEIAKGEEWQKFGQSIEGVKQAMSGLFGGAFDNIASAFDQGRIAAVLAAAALEKVAWVLNKIYDGAAFLGLVDSRAELERKQRESDPKERLDRLQAVSLGYSPEAAEAIKKTWADAGMDTDLRSIVQQLITTMADLQQAKAKQEARPETDKVTGPATEALQSASTIASAIAALPDAQRSALSGPAGELQAAAQAIIAAAARLQTPNVTVNAGGGGKGQAAAPAPATSNGQSYGGK